MYNRIQSFLIATAAVATITLASCIKSPDIATKAPSASPSVGNVSDVDVTEHVKTALAQNETLKGFDISVVTLKGDVRLTGVVETQAQIDAVITIARAAEGAHSIHDELTLKAR